MFRLDSLAPLFSYWIKTAFLRILLIFLQDFSFLFSKGIVAYTFFFSFDGALVCTAGAGITPTPFATHPVSVRFI